MAYQSYNNFINPVRKANSSLFTTPSINNQHVIRNQGYNVQHPHPSVYHNRLVNRNGQMGQMGQMDMRNKQKPLVQPQHQVDNNYEHIPPHMINNNKRLELIKKEKDKLYQTLKDNEHLEQRLLQKSEQAIKNQQESEVSHIKSQIQVLRKELEKKEELEKHLNDRQIRQQILQERLDLSKIQEHKNDILDKIANQENSIIKLREREEKYRLEQEKELLSKQWDQIQLEKERKRQIELTEKESRLRLEKQRMQLEEDERTRLRKETDDLRGLLEHRNNQEEWLARRISNEKRRELNAEKIRNGKIDRLSKSDHQGSNSDSISNSSNDTINNIVADINKTKHRHRQREQSVNLHNEAIYNGHNGFPEFQDGYQSDVEGFGDIDNIFNEPLFQRAKIDNLNNRNIDTNNKTTVDPNEYELDKIEGLSKTTSNNNNNNNNLNEDTLSAASNISDEGDIQHIANNIRESVPTQKTNQANRPSATNRTKIANRYKPDKLDNIGNQDNLDYHTIMNKLMNDMTNKKPKNKKQSEQLTTMLHAVKTMSKIYQDDEDDENELRDELRDPNNPHEDIPITTRPKGLHQLPSDVSGSELSSDILELHKQMADIKGILKNT